MLKEIENYHFEDSINIRKGPTLVKALCQKDGSFVSIKFIPKTILNELQMTTINRINGQYELINHQNLVKIHKNFLTSDGLFIVTDYCNDNSLLSKINQCGCFSEDLVAKFTVQILLALDYLHSIRLHHNNLKASNILLHNGRIKLTDFGIPALLRCKRTFLCPYWTAPEVLVSNESSSKADIWSLGCSIIELLTGKPPNIELSPEEARFQILNHSPNLPSKISPELLEFLNCCFIHNPDQRFSIKQLAELKWIHLYETDPV